MVAFGHLRFRWDSAGLLVAETGYFVEPTQRQKGLGTQFKRGLIAEARRFGARGSRRSSIPSNIASVRLNQKLGFTFAPAPVPGSELAARPAHRGPARFSTRSHRPRMRPPAHRSSSRNAQGFNPGAVFWADMALARETTLGHGESRGPAGRRRELYRFLGRPHVLDILHAVCDARAPLRFVEIQRRLQVSPNTLTDRLRDLVAAGLLTRSRSSSSPPRVDYAPTPKAEELGPCSTGSRRGAAGHPLTLDA